jgi:hypothetical protein
MVLDIQRCQRFTGSTVDGQLFNGSMDFTGQCNLMGESIKGFNRLNACSSHESHHVHSLAVP